MRVFVYTYIYTYLNMYLKYDIPLSLSFDIYIYVYSLYIYTYMHIHIRIYYMHIYTYIYIYIACCLLPLAYYPSAIAHRLLPITFCLLPIIPISYCPLPVHCILLRTPKLRMPSSMSATTCASERCARCCRRGAWGTGLKTTYFKKRTTYYNMKFDM